MDKLIINAALTGIVPLKSDNSNLPVSPEEIVQDACRCRDAGASIVHIHARDRDQQPTFRKDVYYEIMAGIRGECPDLLISGSTSGRVHKELWQRTEVLRPGPGIKPDLASLTLGSMNFRDAASVNTPEMIQALARTMKELGIVPELELFEIGMAEYARFLSDKGILEGSCYGNIMLGSLGTMGATPSNLTAFVKALPDNMVWSAGGLGRFQFSVNAMAVTMGGHVRVGLEDSLFFDTDKTRPASNPGLVDRIVTLARAAGREIASPDEARQIIGIPRSGEKGGQAPPARQKLAPLSRQP
ncbi:MAG: 3-keto-5-aminohexanoate cleavage protein [Deltaproteobacteria bacterium]